MTDKIAEIRERHQEGIRASADADRAYLLAEVDRLTRERDEALEEIRCLGLSEALAKHSGSPSREWHSVGAWLYPGETINHVVRSPGAEPEAKP